MQLLQKLKLWSEYHNPFHYWWLSRKYFKKPKAHLVKGRYTGYFGLPIRTDSYHKGLNFFCRGLGWKSKYDSPRHEWDPIICIIWVNPWKSFIPNRFSKTCKQKIKWFNIHHFVNDWHIDLFTKIDIPEEKGFYSNKQYWFGFVFNWMKDPSDISSMATWEAMLDYAVWGHNIEWCYNHNIWKSDKENITIIDNIKWKPTLKE